MGRFLEAEELLEEFKGGAYLHGHGGIIPGLETAFEGREGGEGRLGRAGLKVAYVTLAWVAVAVGLPLLARDGNGLVPLAPGHGEIAGVGLVMLGAIAANLIACNRPLGYTDTLGDCYDEDANTSPDAAEVCDTRDNDCDTQVDEGVTTTYYRDRDDDGNKIWDDPSVSGGKGGRRRREIMKKVGAYVTVVNMHRTL